MEYKIILINYLGIIMKKSMVSTLLFYVVLAITALYFTGPSYAAGPKNWKDQCATTKSSPGKNGALVAVSGAVVYTAPGQATTTPLPGNSPMLVVLDDGTYLQLKDGNSGKPIGYALKKTIELQDLSNCEF